MKDHPELPSEHMKVLMDARKKCRLCMSSHPGAIRNGSEFHFDPDVVSHWSQWLGDLQPKLLVVGQDFGDTLYFEKYQGSDDPRSRTNENLHELLIAAGFKPKPPPLNDVHSGVFLTNSILCFKVPKTRGDGKAASGMGDSIQSSWSAKCAKAHLWPLIKSLNPQGIVALGGPAWKSVSDLFDIREAPPAITQAAGKWWNVGRIQIFAAAHCGPKRHLFRSREVQLEDWRRIGSILGTR
jgi:Uracil DNA glycosylase superfamily